MLFLLPLLPSLHSHFSLILWVPVWVWDPMSLELCVSIWLAWLERQFQTLCRDNVKITVGHKKVVTNNSKDTTSANNLPFAYNK